MQQIVCIKQVPGTSVAVKPDTAGKDIVRDGIEYEISPYDEYAVEYALSLKGAVGAGQVALLTLAPERSVQALRKALAMGCDSAFHVKDDACEGGDPAATARVLAAAIRKIGAFDIVWTGKHAVEEDAAQTGQWIAELLDLPHVAEVRDVAVAADRKSLVAIRDVDGGEEHVECSIPCVLTATKGRKNEKGESVEPRFASLPGIMKAKRIPIGTWTGAELGLAATEVGAAGALVRRQSLALPAARPGGLRWIEGELDQVVAETVRIFREELKVI